MGMFCLHNSNSWTGETYVYRIMRVGFEFNYDLKQSNVIEFVACSTDKSLTKCG